MKTKTIEESCRCGRRTRAALVVGPMIALLAALALYSQLGAGLGSAAALADGGGDPLAIWSAIGSVGVADESSWPKTRFNGSRATVKNAGTVLLRYTVNAPDGWTNTQPGDGFTMALRYRDNGPKARVTVRLMELDMTTGVEGTIVEFDSNDLPQSPGMQMHEIDVCDFEFDFFNRVYHVEAVLKQNNAHGKAALETIQLVELFCI